MKRKTSDVPFMERETGAVKNYRNEFLSSVNNISTEKW